MIINFFSLIFTGIEIEGEKVSSSQNKRTLRRGGGVLENEQGQTRGERGSNPGNLERTYFLNNP